MEVKKLGIWEGALGKMANQKLNFSDGRVEKVQVELSTYTARYELA